MKRILRIAIKAGLFVGIILVGLGLWTLLVFSRPVPERAEPRDPSVVVETRVARAETHSLTVQAQGTIVGAQTVPLSPQVTGRVTYVNPAVTPGGRVQEGDTLVRIDARDYQLAVQQRAADLDRARLDLELERARGTVAQREVELFNDGEDEEAEASALAHREPQLETAEAVTRAAAAGVRRARLDLDRTRITAPFDAFVQSENVDIGQVVGPGSPVLTLIGSHVFWVHVSVPLESLAHIDVPGLNADAGSPALVWQQVGEERIERAGRVVRLLGDLDPVGRMARVLVEIPQPLDAEGLPLLVGAYVNVEIDAGSADDLIEVPRVALREGSRVWVMNDESELEIRPVTIHWRREDSVLVSAGISDGESIVTSRIPTPVSGMMLREAEPEPTPEQPANAPSAP